MFPGGADGFANAPITKALMLGLSASSLAAFLLELRPSLQLELTSFLIERREYWRIITSHCAFTTTGDVFSGLFVIYSLRAIERQFGSAKYAAFMITSSAMATLLELAALYIGRAYGLSHIPPGPYGLIFAGLYQFHAIIPRFHDNRFLTIELNEHTALYTAGLWLMRGQYPSSLVAGVLGLFVGALYRIKKLGLSRWRLPNFLNRFALRFLDPLFSSRQRPADVPTVSLDDAQEELSSSSSSSSSPLLSTSPSSSSTSSTDSMSSSSSSSLSLPTQRTATTSNPANPAYVTNLQAMFPDRDSVAIARALTSSDNDINRAVQYLLDHP